MSESQSTERYVGIVPYQEGAVLPPTAYDAYEDLVRYVRTLKPREEVDRLVTEMDVVKVVQAAQGEITRSPLSDFEKWALHTTDHCIRTGLLKTPIQAIVIMTGLKEFVSRGNIFRP